MDIRKLSASSASSPDNDNDMDSNIPNGSAGQSVVLQGWKKIRYGPHLPARGPPRPTRPKNETEARFPAHLLVDKTSPRSVMTSSSDAMSVDEDKTVPQKRGAGPATELMPPPNKKKRATTPVGAGRISRAGIEAQLPGAAFGHAAHVLKKEYWTFQDEKALRKTSWGWTAEDEEALAGHHVSDAEAAVHEVVEDVFGSSCADLFRYGLCCHLHVRGAPTQEAEKRADANFWKRLLHLLPHPYWAGDMAKLRFALQMAVLVRFGSEHAVPVGPPFSAQTDHNNNNKSSPGSDTQPLPSVTARPGPPEPGFISWLRQCMPSTTFGEWGVRKEMAYVHEFLFQAQLQSTPKAQRILHHLYYRPHKKLDTSLLEHFLFVLRQEDVEALRVALDTIWYHEEKAPGAEDDSVGGAWQRYLADRAARQKGPLGKQDRSEVRKRLKEATLARRREALIRCRMRAAGEVDRLPDVPPSDPNADFQLWHHLNEAQLLVVNGECMLPDVKRWLVQAAPDAKGRDMLWDIYLVMTKKMAHYRIGGKGVEGPRDDHDDHDDHHDDAKKLEIPHASGLLFSAVPAQTTPKIREELIRMELAEEGDEESEDHFENKLLIGVRARTWREAEAYEPAIGLIFSWTRVEPKAPSVRIARALMSEFRPLTPLLAYIRRRREQHGHRARTSPSKQHPWHVMGHLPGRHDVLISETLAGEHFYV